MKNIQYFAFVTTNQPSIQPLEGATDFESENDIVEGMQKQGEIVPSIFGREDLVNMKSEINKCLSM